MIVEEERTQALFVPPPVGIDQILIQVRIHPPPHFLSAHTVRCIAEALQPLTDDIVLASPKLGVQVNSILCVH